MSTPIKGPGGGPPGAGLPESEGPSGPKTGGATETFREALDGAEKSAAPEAAASPPSPDVGGVAGADPVANVAADLRAGRIDVATALDRIVERALASGPASALAPAARRDLETFLRETLADDPTLQALAKDLERGH